MTSSRLARMSEVASDLLIATALIWALPLLVGVVVAAITFVKGAP